MKHKSHIIKMMCFCASVRPRQNPDSGEWWDGKLGMGFFVEYVAAKRSSANRPAGTIETKSINVDNKNFACDRGEVAGVVVQEGQHPNG